MSLLTSIDPERLPRHLAIIMDGNGRWARQKGKLRVFGHENGAKSVRTTVETCARLGVEYLTLYAFSTENWKRPKLEVDTLMKLLLNSIRSELKTLHENNIKVNVIGNLDMVPQGPRKAVLDAIEKTKNNSRMTLTLALSYGSREEIISMIRDVSDKVKNNIISKADINESIINEHLYTRNLPDVDLLVRTSGEHRISNFLLWQIAYAELYFTDALWPDFNEEELYAAIVSYQKRERRFGKTSEQLNNNP